MRARRGLPGSTAAAFPRPRASRDPAARTSGRRRRPNAPRPEAPSVAPWASFLNPINPRQFTVLVERHDGDAHDGSFRGWDRMVALDCARLGALDILRGLEQGWNANRQHIMIWAARWRARPWRGADPSDRRRPNPVRRIAAGDRSDRRRGLLPLASPVAARDRFGGRGRFPGTKRLRKIRNSAIQNNPPSHRGDRDDPARRPAREARLAIDQGLGRRLSLGARRPDRSPRSCIAAGAAGAVLGSPHAPRRSPLAGIVLGPDDSALLGAPFVLGLARARRGSARAARAHRPAGLQSVSIFSQPLECTQNAKKWLSKSFNGRRTRAKRRDRGPISARGCSGAPRVPRRSPLPGIVLGPGGSVSLGTPFVWGLARPGREPARAARARRPAGLQSVSIFSQTLGFP